MSDLELGPFRIGKILGRGGMGVVFEAIHRTEGVPVAVKIIVSEHAQTRWFRLAFRREIQAMARLAHPGISAILDAGVLGKQPKPDETFRENRPWFAMEYVDGSPLEEVTRWGELRRVLGQILDALAHAHALGVIHRDIKPQNVLVSNGAPKLVDFGLASFVEEVPAEDQRRILGTPRYMAPEQILGRWRDQGPATDLYSLGCIAWRLACGEELTAGDTTDGVLQEHLQGVFESRGFEPRFLVPEGFEEWLGLLLARQPEHRFQRAADAAFALSKFPMEYGGGAVPAAPNISKFSIATTAVDLGPTQVIPDIADDTELLPGAKVVDEAITPAPIPAHPPSERPVAGNQLRGAGLSLFGMRLVPVVDRTKERQTLWQTLRQVDRERQPRVVVLSGPPGSGKTRLAEWLAHRSHEVGATTILRAFHDPDGGGHDGLGGMVARHFRCVDLEREDAEERIAEVCQRNRRRESLSSYDISTLTQLATPHDEQQYAAISATERFLVLQRLLAQISEERAVVLWLDDADHSTETLAFVHSLLRPGIKAPIRVIVVMTVDEDADGIVLDEVVRHDRAVRMPLGPLSDDDQLELVQHLLQLEPNLAAEVAERTEGSPLFAVQLVGDWIERGALTLGEHGFVAAADEEYVPDDIHDLWRNRLDRTMAQLGGRSEACRRALEIAAAFGRDVDDTEWRRACRRAGVRNTDEFVELMHRQGLVRGTERGWRFAHGMLRESVIRGAREGGRYAEDHELCAETLRELYDPDSRGTPRRLATHLIEASRLVDAVDPLFEAARQAWRFAEYDEANAWLNRHDEALDQLGLPGTDRRRIRRAWLRGFLLHESGRAAEAKALVADAIDVAERSGWDLDFGNLCRLRGNILRDEGEFDLSLASYRRAQEALEAADDRDGVGRIYSARGGTLLKQGRLKEARECLERAETIFKSVGNDVMRARTQHHIGYTYIAQGRYEAAREAIDRAMILAKTSGNRVLEANCWNNLGEAARFETRWDEAADNYERAAELWTEAGHRDADIARVNLAMVHLAAGRYKKAGPLLAVLEAKFAEVGFRFAMPVIHVGRACVAVHTGDFGEWDRRLTSLEELLSETGLVEKDLAWLAELAGDRVADAGDVERGARAWRISESQWRQLGEGVEAARLGKKIQRDEADG